MLQTTVVQIYRYTFQLIMMEQSLPASATWIPLSATLSTGGFEWASSGAIDLSSFAGTNTYLAFKYTGTNSDGKTWELDNITINK